MLPPMLPTRPWPQTLLLTILTLLIAAATIMLACGPAAQPIPEEGDTFTAMQPLPADGDTRPAAPQVVPADGPSTLPPAQQEGGDSAGESGDTAPPPPPPKPTLTYPNIDDSGLHIDVVEFEEAQDAASGPSGQSDAAVEDTVVLVRILLSSNKAEVAAWLRSKGITPLYAEDADYGNLAAEVPLSLLGALSQRDGVREVRRPYPTKPGS